MDAKYLEMYRVPDPTGKIKVGNFLYLMCNGLCISKCINKLNLDPNLLYTLRRYYHKLRPGKFMLIRHRDRYMNMCEETLLVKVGVHPSNRADTMTHHDDGMMSMREANRRKYDVMAMYRTKVSTLETENSELKSALTSKNKQLQSTKRKIRYEINLNRTPKKVCCRINCDIHTIQIHDNDTINNYINDITINHNINTAIIACVTDNVVDCNKGVSDVVDCNKGVSDVLDCNNRTKLLKLFMKNVELMSVLKSKNYQLRLMKNRLYYRLNRTPKKVCCRVNCDNHMIKTLNKDIINNNINDTTINDIINDITIRNNINDNKISNDIHKIIILSATDNVAIVSDNKLYEGVSSPSVE